MQLLATDTLKQLPAAILPRLIKLFMTTTPDLITAIQQAAVKNDLVVMAEAAHKLKGSCLSLGAEQMAAICKELQEKGEANDNTGIHEHIATLSSLYPQTLEAMQTL
ncbi:Hpt domain-containing protein [uncultured Thiothrix sp.]|uniref:Hpt domain-containing protein n=1 Tax=uncultured Thiothrix sp. TaxID=223185 RepID=UPI0026025AC6|nr:Hpt domain-containing protein [uncultured Thiothrix sp.]